MTRSDAQQPDSQPADRWGGKTLSVFDLYSIGIGPSSSHTVGPMRAARLFAEALGQEEVIASITVTLYGSLGATGVGHGTDKAVILGLEGADPATIDVEAADRRVALIREQRKLQLSTGQVLEFDPGRHIVMDGSTTLPLHSNAMTFQAVASTGGVRLERTYYSVGGGFVAEAGLDGALIETADAAVLEFPFASGDELLDLCRTHGLSISELMMRNELAWRSESEVIAGLLEIWDVMRQCVDAGFGSEGVLPGGLGVRRRAPALHRRLQADAAAGAEVHQMDWLNLFALAVNEQNASGGRVVTAPTNGAAGIIPAVLHYYQKFIPTADRSAVVSFLLTAGAIGMLFKMNASISGAEMGCQGEVGSACAMAAGALCEVLGGTPQQVENAAEVGIEHNLGLTCDPVGGLVQIPCIERNAIASVKAVNAARLSLHGDGRHKVSLDQAIRTMRQTGLDMHSKYKETSLGGLAVNVVEC